eukprot:TRINITY_DN22195_c0_g1_i1.p1 TRINITY_DN22195_c0_g1~~TRINITY_DN22195_c0_g1_i1.p1  ORF type:complete len:206 (+),score=1.60 TRINITY_DN22195_c0_g1_i1:43-660(+)
MSTRIRKHETIEEFTQRVRPSARWQDPWIWCHASRPEEVTQPVPATDDSNMKPLFKRVMKDAVARGSTIDPRDLDRIAKHCSCMCGKWLIYIDKTKIDDVWSRIAQATFNNQLGPVAKVATLPDYNKNGYSPYVICVYTYSYLDTDDVARVLGKLREMGLEQAMGYKPDLYTYLGIYRADPALGLSETRWTSHKNSLTFQATVST